MKIASLLSLDQKEKSKDSLAENLGDGFLVSRNPLYNHIRQRAIEGGASYSCEGNLKYLALPLSQLDQILSTKKVPYFDNVSVLAEIEKKRPNLILWDHVTDNLKKNSVFHESCHLVAHTMFSPYFADRAIHKEAVSEELKIILFLIEESFANSCELMGVVFAEDTAHRLFYELNSYIFMWEDKGLIRKCISDYGFTQTFQVIFYAYLFSNFLRDQMSLTDWKQVFAISKDNTIQSWDLKKLNSIYRIALDLNPRFRWVTTEFHLKLQGINKSSPDLPRIDFLGHIERSPQLKDLVKSLIDSLKPLEDLTGPWQKTANLKKI